MLFRGASEGKIAWYGTPESYWTLIHVDDLAEMYLLLAEKAQLAGGKIFDAANDFAESLPDILQKLAEVSGCTTEPVFLQPTTRKFRCECAIRHSTHPYTAFEFALSTTSLLKPYMARNLLGWHPRKLGLVDNMEIYYNAWKASVGLVKVEEY